MEESVSRCESCGAALAPGAKFCAECGQPARSRFCEQCGAKVAPGVKFCEECGSPLAERGAAAPVAAPPYSQPPVEAAPLQRAAQAEPAWAEDREALETPRPKPRKRSRGCWWVLLALILLAVVVVVAAVLLGWVAYNSATGNLHLFPNGVPFIATPTPLP